MKEPSVSTAEVDCLSITKATTWMTPIQDFLVMRWQEGDLDYDSEPEGTLLRRRREARRRERQAALEQQLNMAAEHHDDNLNLENNQNRVTLSTSTQLPIAVAAPSEDL
ncbi:hypothetical protein PIB30_027254 [Stylosanthes scabra]|uniref:Uncharacterized protein n=1 Tax=Stylosanthes scabra TaxID=79078 RepID=A0ABU6V9K7_9FABA|nr:hypothetical protein [Stylosanthes scabra]